MNIKNSQSVLGQGDYIDYLLGYFRCLHQLIETIYSSPYGVVARYNPLSLFYTQFTKGIDEVLETGLFPEISALYKKPWGTLFKNGDVAAKEWEEELRSRFEDILTELEKICIDQSLGMDIFEHARSLEHIVPDDSPLIMGDVGHWGSTQLSRLVLIQRFEVALDDYRVKLDRQIFGRDKLGLVIYRGIHTNFEEGKIWVEGAKKGNIRRKSDVMRLWQLLLLNIGEVIDYREVAYCLGFGEEWESSQKVCKDKIWKTRNNLVARLKKTGVNGNEIKKWFISSEGIGLKKEETSTS
jgi:hypothetical protein